MRLLIAALLPACAADFPAYAPGDGGLRLDFDVRDVNRPGDASAQDLSVFDEDAARRPDRDDGREPPDASASEDAEKPESDDAQPPVDAGRPHDAAVPPPDAATPDAGVDGPRFRYVDAGKEHTCAIRRDYTILCWGDAGNGRLIPPPGEFQRLSLGEAHGCAWGDIILPACWGRNDAGSTAPPFALFRLIEAGRHTTCGLDLFSDIHCWGEDDHGLISRAPNGGWYDISLTWEHACVTDLLGGVVCWGDGADGQAIEDPTGWLAAAGSRHTCVMDGLPRTHCAGMPDEGPPGLAVGVRFRALAAGGGHTCGITPELALQCWGENRDGQATPPPGRFVQVSAGEDHTCALREDGEVVCWGKNDRGQATVPR